MKTYSIGRPTLFGELEAGSCFAFRRDAQEGRNYVAIKTMANVFGRPYSGAVAIWPGHPKLRHLPGMCPGSLFVGPVIHFPDARIIASTSAQDLAPGPAGNETPGFLIYLGKFIAIAKDGEDGNWAVDLATGAILPSPNSEPAVYISRWSITVQGPDSGEVEIICTWPEEAD